MEDRDAKYWLDRGIEFYDIENFEDAIKCFAKADSLEPNNDFILCNWGNALADLAGLKQDESLFKKSYEKYAKATYLKPNDNFIFCFWGNALSELARFRQDESLFRKSYEKYAEAARLKPNDDFVFYNWGNALSDLARLKQDKYLFNESFEKYSEAVRLKPNDNYVFPCWGIALIELAETNKDENLLKKAFENFYKESNNFKRIKNILKVFVLFNNTKINKMLIKERFYPLLDSNNDDGCFFKETTKSIDKKILDKYKEVYILSISIISLLHANNDNEKLVAHYTNKTASQKMLFKEKEERVSKFRLNAINYSNDPTEGKTLLDYLFKEKSPTREALNTEYGAFAGCFAFNYDSLNQFRLYDKEGKEGTGLSLVFKDSFFSEEAKMAMEQLTVKNKMPSKKEIEEKYALFRCIYIDPITQRVETVGYKEAHLFYRENEEKSDKEKDTYKKIEKITKDYHKDITNITENVREKMEELKELVKELDPIIVGKLLINLRYLTKHIAFKEEQECRIVKIHRLGDEKIVIHSDNDGSKQMYVEYRDIPSHVDKIYFGPKATEMEWFQDILTHNLARKNIYIPCKKSTNPLA